MVPTPKFLHHNQIVNKLWLRHRAIRNKTQKQLKLTCLVINWRNFKNKIAGIVAVIIDEHEPDVIFGSESWLNSEIINCKFGDLSRR